MSKAEVINIIRAYLNVLKQEGIVIEKAFLYGSYARDEASESSDIDLLLVSSLFDTDDDYVLSKPWVYTTKVDHRIEPFAVGLKRFQTDNVSPILELVRQEGIEVQA
ncbi:MAG: nucleotidyltransferase domain-containing protein [Bacteroidales bacterium]|nr:nucleotidyltransferase domain-containing protein [Bacteroidales bacterium]